MRMLIYAALLLGSLFFADARALSAQGERDDGKGIGGIIEWIHKLSGPPFFAVGISAYLESADRDVRGRATLMYRWSYRESRAGLTNNVHFNALTFQPSVEATFGNSPIDVGSAIVFYMFGGDARRFFHYSLVPVMVQRRERLSDDVVLRGGVGLHYFAPFPDSAFFPYTQVTVQRDGWERRLLPFAGFEFRNF